MSQNHRRHEITSGTRIIEALRELLASGPVGDVRLATHRAVPSGPVPPSLTVVPFILAPLKGSIRVYADANGEDADVEAGEVIFFPSGSWVSCGLERLNRMLRITLDVDNTLFGVRTGSIEDADVYLYTAPWIPDPGTLSLVERLEKRASPREAVHAMNLLLLDLLQRLEQEPRARVGKAYRTWTAILDFLEGNAHRPISRDDVASTFNLHPAHVSKLFKRFAGISFIDYLQKIRIRRAEVLLRDTDLGLDETASLCGFSSANYFIRVFRKQHGRSPGKWRLQTV